MVYDYVLLFKFTILKTVVQKAIPFYSPSYVSGTIFWCKKLWRWYSVYLVALYHWYSLDVWIYLCVVSTAFRIKSCNKIFNFMLFQSLAPQKVERELYNDEVTTAPHKPTAAGDSLQSPASVTEDVLVPTQAADHFHQRPPTRSGGRHMQESSFSLSGTWCHERDKCQICKWHS